MMTLKCKQKVLPFLIPGWQNGDLCLSPLAEIASALIHPTSGLSVAEMLGKLPEPKGVLNVRRGFAAQAWEAIGNRQAGGRQ